MNNVLEFATAHGLMPKRVSSSKGGEFSCACPFCGGDDRFRIWPEQNAGNGSYWCRQCNVAGDRIQFVMDTQRIGFKAACRVTGDGNISDQYQTDSASPYRLRIPSVQQTQFIPKNPAPSSALSSADLWMEKAWKMASWAAGKLAGSPGETLLIQKGINTQTAADMMIGWLPEDVYRPREAWGLETVIKPETGKPKRLWLPAGLVIPNQSSAASVNRLRIRRPDGEPRYYIVPGSSPAQMILGTIKRSVIIVESELDAILLYQCAGDITSIIALGTSHAKPDARSDALLNNASCILVSLDYDDAGKSGFAWWSKNYPKKSVWHPSPAGKDPSEASQHANLSNDDLRTWIISGWPLGWRQEGLQIEKTVKTKTTPDPVVNPEQNMDPLPKHPSTIAELHDLLKKNRQIKIIVTHNRLKIDAPIDWINRQASVLSRLSALIFFDPTVFNYLHRHGANNINANNLLEAQS